MDFVCGALKCSFMIAINGILVILLAGSLAADGTLTFLMLKHGGRELNPMMVRLMGKVGVRDAMLLSRGIGILLASVFWLRNEVPFLIGMLISTTFFVSCGAYGLLKKTPGKLFLT